MPYVIHEPAGEISPVVFDSPHSGTVLPAHFKYACRREDLSALSDLHVEQLIEGAVSAQIPVLESIIHRAVIDLNRYANEINPADMDGGWPYPHSITVYTKAGRGLIPMNIGSGAHLTPIYNRAALPAAIEIESRINDYYKPYHDALRGLLKQAFDRHGITVHGNIHSARRNTYGFKPDIILGTLYGRSCAPEVADFAQKFFESRGMAVGLNDPFAGAALIDSTADPKAHKHSLQVEIVRDLYMNMDTLALDPGKTVIIRKMMTDFAAGLHALALTMKPG